MPAPPTPRGPLERVRRTFRARVAGDPTGAPRWVRDVALVGGRDGWFDPHGVVWAVHGGLSTLVGGLVALLGQAAHPLALAGVQGHSDYREDPWARLAGTARWLVVCTFGSAELAERDCARVRGMHRRVRGRTDDGRAYSARDADLLRWVHLAFTDAFLAAHRELGADLSGRFGPRWADTYVRDWARTAQALGVTDLPASEAELAEALAGFAPVLEPVPADLRRFLLAPPGLTRAEAPFYAGLTAAAELLLSPVLAPSAGAPGRAARGPGERLRLAATRTQLRALRAVTGREPWEQAGRYRTGTGLRPDWL
ncbi:oxygenase MpaB family protein [Kineococcus sp. SYSU DK018]|uniref:oxygenase MpaB family protein n=1 Tax=Kineococcus sp. SYSU DK018 TaxID=3383139 RepID=UPI003D7E59EC